MASIFPGDHPLTDVINFDLEIYGKEADVLLKKLDLLMSRHKLWEWWIKDIGWECNSEKILSKIKKQLSTVETMVKEDS